MNDQERLAAFLDKIKSVDGLDERRFQRLSAELDRPASRAGYDDQGRLKVALFDAKSYDMASFDMRIADNQQSRILLVALASNHSVSFSPYFQRWGQGRLEMSSFRPIPPFFKGGGRRGTSLNRPQNISLLLRLCSCCRRF